MKLIIKKLLILFIGFMIILWLQNVDDKKYNKIRSTTYDKYKVPLFFSCFIYLLLNSLEYFNDTSLNIKELYEQDIYIEPFI